MTSTQCIIQSREAHGRGFLSPGISGPTSHRGSITLSGLSRRQSQSFGGLMPRVKLIYIGNGEWIAPTKEWGKCDHPTEWLRSDARWLGYVYCCQCGQPYIHHSIIRERMTDEERADLDRRVAELKEALGVHDG